MTTIFLVRHGEAENPNKVLYGRLPGFHLTDQGKKESERAGKFLAGTKISTIFTSPLERCFETADIISKYVPGAKIEHLWDLTEVDGSHWQGLTWDEVVKSPYYEKMIN